MLKSHIYFLMLKKGNSIIELPFLHRSNLLFTYKQKQKKLSLQKFWQRPKNQKKHHENLTNPKTRQAL